MTKLTIDGYQNKKENKYFHIYKRLIQKRLMNPVDENIYSELHHILPKSLGGTNETCNLIKLTAKEHYIAHLLLTKFIFGKDRYKVLNAFFCMNMKSKNTINRYSSSRLYQFLKEELSDEKSKFHKKLWEDEEYKNLMSERAKISWYDGSREYQIERMRNNSPFKIKEIHEKTIKSRSDRGTNVWVTNNPMKNKDKALKIASKRSGKNHYAVKNTQYEYRLNNGNWKSIDIGLTIKQICEQYDWDKSTFNYIIRKNKTPKRGRMMGIEIRKKLNNENSKD